MVKNNEQEKLIKACAKGNPRSQKKLYQLFYGYGMSISIRYSEDIDVAREILNDAFMKVFIKIDRYYDNRLSFKGWLRKIIINTAIDHYRKNKIKFYDNDIAEMNVESDYDVISEMSAQEILKLVQQLPPAYRLAFNMYVVEGYKHHEIAEIVGISVGTSKSNLAKARVQLKTMIVGLNKEKRSNYG